MRRVILSFFVVGVVIIGVVAPGAPPAAARPARQAAPPAAPMFRPPVDAPVRDGFRPPANPYGPGNRGIEYATVPGQPVWAAGAGVVAFAGEIAHERYVSVDHGGGLRTTYSYLADLAVAVGTVVEAGTLLGHATDRLHFGAILRGDYVDPARLFALAGLRRVRLVAVDRPWT